MGAMSRVNVTSADGRGNWPRTATEVNRPAANAAQANKPTATRRRTLWRFIGPTPRLTRIGDDWTCGRIHLTPTIPRDVMGRLKKVQPTEMVRNGRKSYELDLEGTDCAPHDAEKPQGRTGLDVTGT